MPSPSRYKVAVTATEISNADSRSQSCCQAGNDLEAVAKQLGVGIRIVARYEGAEVVRRRWRATSGSKTLQDGRFERGENRHVLAICGDHVGTRTASQGESVLSRRHVSARWRVLDDAAHHHSAQPFADIAFLKPGCLGNLDLGGWGHAHHGPDQARLVANADENGECGAVKGRKDAVDQARLWSRPGPSRR
jgi:hypothetical protein